MAVPKGPGRVRVESAPSINLVAPLKARLFNYDVDDATLKREHRDWLADEVVPVLRSCRSIQVDLRGTASRTGSDQHNLRLSEQRAKGIELFLEQNGAAHEQIKFRGLGEAPARAAGKGETSEADEDRAVLLQLNPPLARGPAQFDRLIADQDEDGFDPFVSPRFLMIPAFGRQRTLRLQHGESLRLITTNPFAVQLVDPFTNQPVDELIVCGDRTLVTFESGLPGEAFILGKGVSGGTRELLEVHSLLPRTVDVDVFIVKDSTGRLPVNRGRAFVDGMVNGASKLWRDQANVTLRVGRFEQLDVARDLGDPVTNKETSAGKNFHVLSDLVRSPGRISVFLVWEWNPDDGNADAEVDKIGGRFIIFEDKLVDGSTPGRVLGHEVGHLFTLKHDDAVTDALMFGGAGLIGGRLRKREILQARRGI